MVTKDKQHLTQAGYDKLIKELHELKNKLPDAINKLSEASEQGDISENAEYDDALARRDLLEARINEIERMIANVEIIKKKKTGGVGQVVSYGSIVTLLFNDGKEEIVSLVGSGEVSVDEKPIQISFQSPLGKAIKDAKIGDTVKIKLSSSRNEVTIKAIN